MFPKEENQGDEQTDLPEFRSCIRTLCHCFRELVPTGENPSSTSAREHRDTYDRVQFNAIIETQLIELFVG